MNSLMTNKTAPAMSKTKLKEKRIADFVSKFSHPFDMEDAVIDLRAMAKNYPGGVIPNSDIGRAVDAVLGVSPIPRDSVDPRKLNNVPKFAWVLMELLAIDPRFQRDVMPNHIASIQSKFNEDTIIVPCAVKDPISGKFLLWDGHHTTRVCERMGWTHMPVWYTEADISDSHSVDEALMLLIKHAGNSMITINKSGKKQLSRYDQHMIGVDCGLVEPSIVNNIVKANNCKVVRASKDAGDISHVEHLYAAYDLVQASSGIKGIYLARSLKFHRTTWPKEEVRAIMMLAMARLYQQTEMQTGVMLSDSFDTEFGNILKAVYGHSEKVHMRLKEQFEAHFGSLAAHPVVVTSGLVLTFDKHKKSKVKLAQPEST